MFIKNLHKLAGSSLAPVACGGKTIDVREHLISRIRRTARQSVQLFQARKKGIDISNKWFKSPPWILLLVSLLTACGDSHIVWPDVNLPEFPLPSSMPPLDVVSVGPISELPNAVVNGVTYNTTATNVTINGTTGALTDLQIGHIVTVSGTLSKGWETGIAASVEFEANVVGPIESIDTSRRQIVVMGQPILFDTDTAFDSGIDPLSLTGLNVGTVVQISGFPAGSGEIVATRVEPALSNSDFQVIGTVTGLDLGNLSFQINGLEVDYSSAFIIDLPDGMPAEAMNVVVRGSLSTDGQFIAAQIMDVAQDGNIAAGTQMEITGYILNYHSDTDFEVSGFPVTTDYQTIFYFGKREDLWPGAKVEINGQRTVSGAIVADQIGFDGLAITLNL